MWVSADRIPRAGEVGMEPNKKRKVLAAALLIWLSAVSCQIKMPDFLGGLGSAIENMFRSIGGSFGF